MRVQSPRAHRVWAPKSWQPFVKLMAKKRMPPSINCSNATVDLNNLRVQNPPQPHLLYFCLIVFITSLHFIRIIWRSFSVSLISLSSLIGQKTFTVSIWFKNGVNDTTLVLSFLYSYSYLSFSCIFLYFTTYLKYEIT